MYQVKVKICGLTSVEAALNAAHSGADAIGLNFYPKSSRYLADLALARDICLAVGPFVSTVGLFVDAEDGFISDVLSQVPLSLLQFHGNESESFCTKYERPYIKAMRMKPGEPIAALAQSYPAAQGLLLDTYVPGVPGGTGIGFNWNQIPENLTKPLVLAGGLTCDNVVNAVAQVRPWAVDVSGGVERAPGIKDDKLVRDFIHLAKFSTMPSSIGE